MDYHTIHGQDVSNFSSSSPHRMPTISAAQALLDLKSSPRRYISTSINSLDQALQNRDADDALPGGVSRGKLTEIYGPPGVGKTALGMQLAASALHSGESVVWVDSAYAIPGPRFSQVLTASTSTSPGKPVSDLLLNFTHFFTPSFAHLLALFSHSTSFPPPNTSLIVIDSLSTLISGAFPRSADSTSTPKKPGVVNPAARKFPLMQYLLTSISKLATTRNIAVVLLSPCVTKMQPGAGATLVPAINTTAWDQGLGCRVALFRDWDWETEVEGDGKGCVEVRFAEVLKAESIVPPGGRGRLAAFGIGEGGLHSVSLPANISPGKTPLPLPQNPIMSTPSLPRKRKLSATDLEIPDSEGEDDENYGWGEEDEEAMPEMPPQWQGSEDILIPPVGELEEEEEEEEEEELEEQVDVATLPKLPEPEIEDSEDELA